MTANDIYHSTIVAIKEATATLETTRRRLEMNNMHGEEEPFIEDCDTALVLLYQLLSDYYTG